MLKVIEIIIQNLHYQSFQNLHYFHYQVLITMVILHFNFIVLYLYLLYLNLNQSHQKIPSLSY